MRRYNSRCSVAHPEAKTQKQTLNRKNLDKSINPLSKHAGEHKQLKSIKL